MNTMTILVIAVIAILLLGTWLIPRVFDSASDRIVRRVPELEKYSPEERGKIWLEAVCATLLQWQVIVGFILSLGIVAGLTIWIGDLIPKQWENFVLYSLLLLIVLGARPFVFRRARAVLASRKNDIDENGV